MKLLNVTKFVLGFGEVNAGTVPTEPIDVAMLKRLAGVVAEATTAFENYDYARSLERTESFFWWFCDDYVELVKSRAYATHSEEGAASARAALARALSTIQRLFAPILPFATEEVWSWWKEGSVHRAQWPTTAELTDGTSGDADDAFIEAVGGTIALIRRAKTEAKVSQRVAVEKAVVSGSPAAVAAIKAGWADIADAGSVQSVEFVETNGDITVDVTLAPPAE